METRMLNQSSASISPTRRPPRRRTRAGLWAGAFALAAIVSAGGAAHAWIAALQPDAVLFTPASVMPGNPTAPDVWAFNEKQDVILPVGILLDVQPVNPSVTLPGDLNPVWIPAGTCVCSHFFDHEDTIVSTVTGGARCVRPILGVAIRQPTLDATNFLGLTATVMYPTAANCNAVPGVDCGMELLPQDSLRVDANRVQFSFLSQTPGDRIRVVTAGDPAHCHPIGEGGGGD